MHGTVYQSGGDSHVHVILMEILSVCVSLGPCVTFAVCIQVWHPCVNSALGAS